MNGKTSYRTLQKEKVLDTIRKRAGEHLNAMDIYQSLKNQGVKIGLTTIYRHLEKLTAEGVVVKSVIDENTPACFEYCGNEVHHHHEDCYHCKCIRCGKLIHLHCDDVKKLEEHVSAEHGFHIDMKRTVFFGLCDECRRAAE